MTLTPAELHAIRERLGWTQQALAEALYVHRVSVARWESGARTMTASHEELLRRLVTYVPPIRSK